MKYKTINKIIFNILNLLNLNIPKEKIDLIVNDKSKCLTKEEILIKRFSNALKYVYNNFNQTFNEEIINDLYYLLNYDLCDEKKNRSILTIYYENFDNSVYYFVAKIYYYIFNIFGEKQSVFAFIIIEFIMLKRNQSIIIPYEFSHENYKRAIINKNYDLLARFFLSIEYRINDVNPCKYTKKEIIEKVKQLKEDLKTKFNIRKLYLFGSFAKGSNNENSDIDFLVILDESLINIERLEQISILKEYLSELFECSVDVLDFTFALKELGENEMEHILTLI